MNKQIIGVIIGVLSMVFSACKGDAFTAGSSYLDKSDSIIVLTDTFFVQSCLTESPGVISRPDSFLVGELETRFGTLRASVVTQLSCPVGFVFPESSVIDSMALYIYYRSWFGDGRSPLAIDVYEVDGEILQYSPAPDQPYLTSRDINDFCSSSSKSILTQQRIIIPAVATDSVFNTATNSYVNRVRFPLKDEFVERFTAKRSFESQEEFNEFFKGLYLVSDFGGSSILNILDVNVGVYYHFSFERNEVDGIVQDTISDLKAFYANSEVRQLNLFEYLNDEGDRTDWKERLSASEDTCFVIAPAGIYTSLAIPMSAMRDTILSNIGEKRPYVNLASLRLDVIMPSGSQESWLRPASRMLLMRKSADMMDHSDIESFFAQKKLPSDTLAISSYLLSETDTLGDVNYYYSFDLCGLLTYQLREENALQDTLHMVVVPVTMETATTSSGSTGITGVKQAQTPSATMIRSVATVEDEKKQKQMSFNIVYSGF